MECSLALWSGEFQTILENDQTMPPIMRVWARDHIPGIMQVLCAIQAARKCKCTELSAANDDLINALLAVDEVPAITSAVSAAYERAAKVADEWAGASCIALTERAMSTDELRAGKMVAMEIAFAIRALDEKEKG